MPSKVKPKHTFVLKALDRPLHLPSVNHQHFQRTAWWFIGLVGFFAFVVYAAALTGHYALAFILALASVVFFQIGLVAPRQLIVTLSAGGVLIDEDYFPWTAFKTFWLVPQDSRKGTLYLEKLNGTTLPFHYQKTQLQLLNAYLRAYLPERLQGFTPWGDRFNKLFRV